MTWAVLADHGSDTRSRVCVCDECAPRTARRNATRRVARAAQKAMDAAAGDSGLLFERAPESPAALPVVGHKASVNHSGEYAAQGRGQSN